MLFDTETTGLQYSRDEIIEFSAVVLEMTTMLHTMLQILLRFTVSISIWACL